MVTKADSRLALQTGVGVCVLVMGTKAVAKDNMALVFPVVRANVQVLVQLAGRGAEGFPTGNAQIVEDGLGGEAGSGGTADMLDGYCQAFECVCEAGAERFKLPGPERTVIHYGALFFVQRLRKDDGLIVVRVTGAEEKCQRSVLLLQLFQFSEPSLLLF